MISLIIKSFTILFPSTCLLCRQDILNVEEKPVCSFCLSSVELDPETKRGDPSLVDGYFSAAAFKGPIRELLHAYKYQGKDYLTSLLVDLWIRNWDPWFAEVDGIVPVPMARWKEMNRGYNQAVLLAREMGRRMRKPVYSQWLIRKWRSPSQTALTREERLQNARTSFSTRRSKRRGPPKTLLLVDDVVTTGATLTACAHQLKRMGVQTVLAATIARDA